MQGSARPISIKSDVIRKRSRHDARRSSQSGLDDLPPSPGFSHRTSPPRDTSPTLAPDSTTQMSYNFDDTTEFRSTSSELVGALGNPTSNGNSGNGNNTSNDSMDFTVLSLSRTPCHPDYLIQLYSLQSDPLPFSGTKSTTESDPSMSPPSNKRRMMSTDSANEPLSSATSFSSFGGSGGMTSNGDRYTPGSMDFPFSTYNSNGTDHQPGTGIAWSWQHFLASADDASPQSDSEMFWHPPLVLPTKTNTSHVSKRKDFSSSSDGSSESFGPIARSCSKPSSKTEDSTMDFLHALHDDELFSAYLHMHDKKTISNVEGGHAMYVDETGHGAFFCYFSYLGRYPFSVCVCFRSLWLFSHFAFTSRIYLFTFPQPNAFID